MFRSLCYDEYINTSIFFLPGWKGFIFHDIVIKIYFKRNTNRSSYFMMFFSIEIFANVLFYYYCRIQIKIMLIEKFIGCKLSSKYSHKLCKKCLTFYLKIKCKTYVFIIKSLGRFLKDFCEIFLFFLEDYRD